MDISHIPLALKAKTSWGEWGADFQFISSSSFPTYLKCNTYIYRKPWEYIIKKSYEDHTVTTNIADSCVFYFLVENPIYYIKGH